VPELEALWDLLLQEIVASQQVSRQPLPVVGADGSERTGEVLRVGPFTAWSDGLFLRYLPEGQRFLVPARQPAGDLRAVMAHYGQTTEGVHPVVIDPTRGAVRAAVDGRAWLAACPPPP